MNHIQAIKSWMMAILVAAFISACATTQEEILEDDGTTGDDQTMTEDGTGGEGSGSGAEATGIDSGDTDDGTAIVDTDPVDTVPMTAAEMLEQTDGALSNRTIYFEFDSAKLSSESIEILEVHGDFIAANGEVSVRLEGHTDERGSREYNIALGDRRAQSVRRVLLFQGASSDQVDTVSYGEERPVDPGQNEEAWARNRRVELIYTVK